MSSKTSLLRSLIENDSIKIKQEASSWQEAVQIAINPLIKSNAVDPRYVDAIIESTEEYGPYYILTERLAMPHARPEDGVNKNAFSLTTLKTPITFKNDGRKIDLLIALSATSNEIHVSEALPQIVDIFGDSEVTEKISNAKTKEEIIEIIKNKLGDK